MSVMGSDIVAVTCILLGGAVGTAGLVGLLSEGDDLRADATCSSVVITSVDAPRVVVRMGDGSGVQVAPTAPVRAEARFECLELREAAAEARAMAEEARARMDEARTRAREARTLAEIERREIRELMERAREQRAALRALTEPRDVADGSR
ncbi:MAG TPA: hypothetical protein VK858_06255 [Longimicrobiales bacterium]|nr:hypothetical protein [Longimicrobiales bacterium]